MRLKLVDNRMTRVLVKAAGLSNADIVQVVTESNGDIELTIKKAITATQIAQAEDKGNMTITVLQA